MQAFRNILCVVDVTGEPRPAMLRAAAVATSQQAHLTLLAVLPDAPAAADWLPQQADQALVEHYRGQLGELAAGLPERLAPRIRILFGRLYQTVVREVLQHGHDLVLKVAGSERNLRSRVFGSEDMHLLRKCPAPLWLLREGGQAAYRRILLAVDFDPHKTAESLAFNRQLLESAAALALAEAAELHIVHVWQSVEQVIRLWAPSSSEAQLAAYVTAERERHGQWLQDFLAMAETWFGKETMKLLQVQLHLPEGDADEEIPALARSLDADLLVMGTLARGGIPGLLIGNTAETILHKLDCDVLALKPQGFVSPLALS